MDPTSYSQRRPGAPPVTTRGQLRATTAKMTADKNRGNPDLNYGLGVCKVINIDYESLLVTLRTVGGTFGQFDRVPVPMTFPGAGNRHFFGAMPTIGDFCVVGWMPQETSEPGGGTKTPIILSWVVPGVGMGHDWVTTSEVEQDEHDMTPGERTFLAGAYDRIRHKLRHMAPGVIVGSSAQGSDLILDESVTLANRRGNEIRLRDQDQALIFRSLQQFQAMAGARIYGGMVQRDATFLPTTMVSDGKQWDGPVQSNSGIPMNESLLPADPDFGAGYLTPARILQKAELDTGVGRSFLGEDTYLDPYQFLRRGGFIDETGYVVNDDHQSDAIYGGKAIYRVTAQDPGNAVLTPGAQTLTEYRLEIAHTSDGTLPVTEQTDGFDSDRVPDRDPDLASQGLGQNAPFIEWVMGSVVGNDPFTPDGRTKYGLPLVAVIFDGDLPNPRLEPANLAPLGSNATPTPIQDQLATLFRLTPPMTEGDHAGTFMGFNKQGQFRAMLGGAPDGNSIEALLTGGLKLGIGGAFKLLLNDHFEIGTTGPASMGLVAEEGSVRIFGGGPLKTPESVVEASLGTGRGSQDLPAVDIEARTNARLKANKQVLVKGGNEVVLDAPTTRIWGHEMVEIVGNKRTTIVAENLQTTANAKAQESFFGPKYANPSNFPLHERTYSPTVPGLCEKVTYTLGDREETFRSGSHTTTVMIGDMTYQLDQGTWSVVAATSTLQANSEGITGDATAGVVALTAEAGAASMTGLTSATLTATGGVATVQGSMGVNIVAPGGGSDYGPVISGGSREPFTGLPFSTWGIGNSVINLAPV